MSAQETRNMICECVNNLLTDLPSGRTLLDSVIYLFFFSYYVGSLILNKNVPSRHFMCSVAFASFEISMKKGSVGSK